MSALSGGIPRIAPNPKTKNPLKSVCFVVSSPYTLKSFLLDHIAALSRICRLTCVANWDDPAGLQECGVADVPLVHVPIERGYPPRVAILKRSGSLQRYFRKNRFDVVHSFTPKAGLLAMTAAALAGVPVRIHTFTGQVWASRSGLQRSRAESQWMSGLQQWLRIFLSTVNLSARFSCRRVWCAPASPGSWATDPRRSGH
jgi:hypothetical protein